MAITGEPDGDPMRAGYSVGDTGTGLQAALAISAALYQRTATGKGQYIDVAMLDSAISLLSQSAGAWLNAGIEQRRRGNISISREPTSRHFQDSGRLGDAGGHARRPLREARPRAGPGSAGR